MFRGFTIMMALLMVGISITVSGCSTIMHGSSQDVQFTTIPAGAVAKAGHETCITPCTLKLWRNTEDVNLSYNGEGKSYKVDTHLNQQKNWFTYYFGNVLFLGFPGMIVDSIAGGKWTIDNVNYSFDTVSTYDDKKLLNDVPATASGTATKTITKY